MKNMKNDTFSMKHEKVSTTDSDRGRLVSPLWFRHTGDEVEFKIKAMVLWKHVFHKMTRKYGNVSTTDSDRGRLVSSLRARNQGDGI